MNGQDSEQKSAIQAVLVWYSQQWILNSLGVHLHTGLRHEVHVFSLFAFWTMKLSFLCDDLHASTCCCCTFKVKTIHTCISRDLFENLWSAKSWRHHDTDKMLELHHDSIPSIYIIENNGFRQFNTVESQSQKDRPQLWDEEPPRELFLLQDFLILNRSSFTVEDREYVHG